MDSLIGRRRTAILTLTLCVLLSSCSYESGNGLAGADGTQRSTTSTEDGPGGPLAFAVEGLAESTWRVYNTDDGLNLRVAPGIDSESLGRIDAGTTVTATGSVTVVGETSWFHIETDDESGWVHSGYLKPVDTDDGAAPGEPLAATDTVESAWPAGTELVVAAQPGATLREGPSGDSIVELATGTPVTVTGLATAEWTEIRTSNLRGWIFTELLAEEADDGSVRFPAGTPVVPAEGLTGVNIYDGPDGTVISGLPETEVGLATGRSENGWTEITHRELSGWVLTSELTETDPAPSSQEPATATIDGAGGPVTVHLGPSGLEPILDEVADGSEVSTTGVTTPSGWTEIRLDNVRTGWVPTIFLLF